MISSVSQSFNFFECSREKNGSTADRAKELLLDYLRKTNPDIQESDIEWISQNPHTYTDSSLGWPTDGDFYLPRLEEGTEIHFRFSNQDFTVDTNGSRFVLRDTALLNSLQD